MLARGLVAVGLLTSLATGSNGGVHADEPTHRTQVQTSIPSRRAQPRRIEVNDQAFVAANEVAQQASYPISQMQSTDCRWCDLPEEHWWDNLSFALCLDASKQPQDLGINANFGGFVATNIGLPLVKDWNLGLQAGTGGNFAKAGVKVLGQIEGTVDRQQWFSTVGLFQRHDGWHWGPGTIYKFRTITTISKPLSSVANLATFDDCNEIGMWGTYRSFGDSGALLGGNFIVRPINQLNFYWQRTWETGAVTRLSAGVAERHGKDIIIIRDTFLTDIVPTFGLSIFVPLNDHLALFGEGNFITPSDTGTLDAYLGFAYYPGGGAKRSRTNRYAPVLTVANNPTFAMDLRRN